MQWTWIDYQENYQHTNLENIEIERDLYYDCDQWIQNMLIHDVGDDDQRSLLKASNYFIFSVIPISVY